jgi:tetratricopeptide (TPR) repeat protein
VYELDDDRVTTGTPVQCSTCGHVFTLEAPTDSLPPPDPLLRQGTPGKEGADWLLRKPQGDVLRIRELTTLQKWIVERKVSREDEISKTGRTWKRLGDIPEFTSFFQVVEAADVGIRNSRPPVVVDPPEIEPSSLLAPPMGSAAYPVIPAPQPSSPPPAPPPVPAMVTTHDDDSELDAFTTPAPRRRGRWAVAIAALLGMVLASAFVARAMWQRGELTREEDRSLVTEALAKAELSGLDGVAQGLRRPDDEDADARSAPLRGRLRAQQALSWRLWLALQYDASAFAVAGTPVDAQSSLNTLQQSARAELTVDAKAHTAQVDRALGEGALLLTQPSTSTLMSSLQDGVLRASRVEQDERVAASVRASIDAEARSQLVLAEALLVLDAGNDAGAAPALRMARAKLDVSDEPRLREAAVALELRMLTISKPAWLVRGFGTAPSWPDLLRSIATMPANPTRSRAEEIVKAMEGAWLDLQKPPPEPTLTPTVDAVPETIPAPAGTSVVEEVAAMTLEELEQAVERASRSGLTWRTLLLSKKLVERKPSAAGWSRVGWAYIDVNKSGDAVRAFERALVADVGFAEAHLGLAEAKRFLGRREEAKASYEAYLRLAPDSRDASIAKNALKGLEQP